MAPLLPETWGASVSSDSVVDETLEVDCCGCVGFTLLHSDLSLPTSFPSWLFIGTDIESSPASLGTLLTAVVSGESGSVRFFKKSSDIQGWLVMNEGLYDTGSAVVGLYRLFTNFLKFPWESPGQGVSIGEGVLGITRLPSPILHFSHSFQLKLFEITSLRGDYT